MALDTMNINEFIELLGSDAPAPGGGGAAALTAAIGIALSEMVCSLTLTNKKFADVIDQTADYKNRCAKLEQDFLAGMEKDAAAYRQVNEAYKLPRETDEEKTYRAEQIQKMLIVGATPPFELMGLCVEALELTKELIGKTSKMAISDLGVAALNLNASVKSAWLNVLINICSLNDEQLINEYKSKGWAILDACEKLSQDIYTEVVGNIDR